MARETTAIIDPGAPHDCEREPGLSPGGNALHHLTDHLGYATAELAIIPADRLARFAAVGNPLRIVDTDPRLTGPRPGETVLDPACTNGVDLLLAAHRVGPTGRAIGVIPENGRTTLRPAVGKAGERLEARVGRPDRLPIASASVDVVIGHGATGRCDPAALFREIRRVLKPGGRLLLAEPVRRRPFSLLDAQFGTRWQLTSAAVDGELERFARAAGLGGVRVTERFDCFTGSAIQPAISDDPLFYGVNLYAIREG